MIIVYILCITGLALNMFSIMYKQVLGGAVKSKSSFVMHLFVFSVFQLLMLYTGYILSASLSPMMVLPTHWISMFIFFFLGFKMFAGIKKNKNIKWTFDTSQFKVLLLFSLTNAFDAFFAGIGLGFLTEYSISLFMVFFILIAVVLTLSLIMARRKSATTAVWLFAAFGSSLIGLNTIIILIQWLILK